MEIVPLKYGAIKLKKFDLLENRLLLAIDGGSSMTKILFLHKDNEPQLLDDKLDFVILNHALFNNEDFEKALEWVKGKMYFPENNSHSIHVTGTKAMNNKEKIKSIFGLNVEYVDEMLTIAAGHKIALERIGQEQLMSESVEFVNDGKIESDLFDKFSKGIMGKLSKKSISTFPCLIHVYGSLSGFFYFDENGKGEFASCLLTGGKSFMGLAKCLLNNNNYDEIVSFASKGNRSNVDTQVKEMFCEDPNSPYGKFPPEMPIFSFGKCTDYDKGLESYSKEDLAQSLIGLFSFMIIIECRQICMIKKIAKVYLTGNIFRSNTFKREISRITAVLPNILDIEILDFGYFGALGAMFCGNNDSEIYYKGFLQ